jgi:protein-tyrosine phosphatase
MLPIKSILMVCRGNICRSPMAEGFFKQQLNDSSINITSAGLNAVVNHPADSHAQSVMSSLGIDLSQHRGRQITEDIVRNANLILVMTESHSKDLLRQFMAARGKTFLLGHWQNFEIPDPYMLTVDAFEKVSQQIMLGWQDWKTRILSC